jgi:hypothetical protein
MARHSRKELAEVLEATPESMWTRTVMTDTQTHGTTYSCAFGRALNILGVYDGEYLNEEEFEDITGIEPIHGGNWIRDTLAKVFHLNREVKYHTGDRCGFSSLEEKMEWASDSYGFKAAAHVLRNPDISVQTIEKKYQEIDYDGFDYDDDYDED